MSEQQVQYIKGFNSGYLLAKHMPTLLSKVTKDLTISNDFVEGILMGKEEFEIEQSRNQLKELNQLRNKSKDRDLERE